MAKVPQGKKRITFTLEASGATAVFLSGDFNGWDETGSAMNPKPGGKFEKTAMLLPGRYEYKFKIDGQWQCDPNNPLQCPNAHGTMNSVLVVGNTKK